MISEKPAGVYTKQVRETNEAAAKSDAVYAVMFNQRTNHLYRKMKEIVDGGNMDRSSECHGLLRTGIVHKNIMITVNGAAHGMVKAEAY